MTGTDSLGAKEHKYTEQAVSFWGQFCINPLNNSKFFRNTRKL